MADEKNAVFDRKEVHVGRDFGGITWDITPEFVAKYIAGTGDDNPWYRGDSPLGGPIAPALVLYDAVYRTLGWYLPNIFGNLHTRQEWELLAPVKVGERLTTRSVIVDRYVKRDREYVVNEVLVNNASGQIVSRSRTHQSFLLPEQTKAGFVVDKSREKDSSRSFKIGERGVPEIVVQGMLSVCLVAEMMTKRFGPGFLYGGKMDLRLVNVVWGSDVTGPKGLIVERRPEGSRSRAEVEAWCDKADGTKTVVGTASALEL